MHAPDLSTVEAARERLGRLEGFLSQDRANLRLIEDCFRTALQCAAWDRANLHLAHARSLRPDDPRWVLRQADLLLAQRRFEDARSLLEGLAAHAGDTPGLAPVLIRNLAFIDFCLGDPAACVARLAPLVDAEEGSAADAGGALQQLWVRALHRAGALVRSCEWVAQAEAAGRLSAEAAGPAALAAIDNNDFASARRWLGLALAAPGAPSPEAMAAQATLALAARDPGQACRFADQALALNPGDGRCWSIRGFAHLLAGELQSAATDFARALAFMPGHVGTWHGQGWSQVLAGDLPAAQASFAAALALDRNFAESHGSLALVLALQQQPQAAQEHIARAQRLDPAGLAARYAQAVPLPS